MSTLLSFPSFRRRAPAAPAVATEPPVPPLDLAALVGAEGWARLPADVRRRFAAGHPATTYAGRLDMRCSPIARVHAVVSRLFGAPLLAITADSVPASVLVRDDGRGGVVWERRLYTSGPFTPRTVRSTKHLGAGGGLIERTDGGLSMSLRVFEDAGALVFESRRFALVLGWLCLPVPALFTPGVCRVVHTDLGGGRFRFTLDMRHPLWGHTFHQSGVFFDPRADRTPESAP